MWEVDFTGWIRTPEELEKLKNNKLYRLKMNIRRLFYIVYYKRW